MAPPLSEQAPDVQDFIEDVDEVSLLISGLRDGTISPEYVDRKMQLKAGKKEEATAALSPAGKNAAANKATSNTPTTTSQQLAEAAEQQEKEDVRKEEVARKVKELMANRDRKLKARDKYTRYVNTAKSGGAPGGADSSGTDYTKWDMYCPDDEEDDLFNSLCPAGAQFKAMEKDIDERHRQ